MSKEYLESKDLQKGEELMVFHQGEPIAYSTSHTLSFNSDPMDVSSKMSGIYGESMPGKLSWEISIESLSSITKGHVSSELLMKVCAKRLPIEIEVANVTMAYDESGNKTFTKGAVKYKGKAVITSIQEKSTNGEYDSFSASLKGTGPLLDGTGKELSKAEDLGTEP